MDLCRALLLDFAAALIPGLDEKLITLLFSSVKPIMQVCSISRRTTLVSLFQFRAIIQLAFDLTIWSDKLHVVQDSDGKIQKKAYKILSVILKVCAYLT